MYDDQDLERENSVKWSDKGEDDVTPPSSNQSLSHLLCQIRVYPLVFLEGKTVDPQAPVSKVENKTFHRRKGTWQVFSRSLDILGFSL